jgi:hypothetical protein
MSEIKLGSRTIDDSEIRIIYDPRTKKRRKVYFKRIDNDFLEIQYLFICTKKPIAVVLSKTTISRRRIGSITTKSGELIYLIAKEDIQEKSKTDCV